jgi:hypothetical protein
MRNRKDDFSLIIILVYTCTFPLKYYFRTRLLAAARPRSGQLVIPGDSTKLPIAPFRRAVVEIGGLTYETIALAYG